MYLPPALEALARLGSIASPLRESVHEIARSWHSVLLAAETQVSLLGRGLPYSVRTQCPALETTPSVGSLRLATQPASAAGRLERELENARPAQGPGRRPAGGNHSS